MTESISRLSKHLIKRGRAAQLPSVSPIRREQADRSFNPKVSPVWHMLGTPSRKGAGLASRTTDGMSVEITFHADFPLPIVDECFGDNARTKGLLDYT